MIQTKDYTRDSQSGALINNNREEYERYKKTKMKLRSAEEMCKEINSIKQDIQELRQLLGSLLDRTQ